MANLAGQRTGAQIVSAVGSILFQQTAASTSTYPTSTTILELVNRYYKIFVSKYEFLWSMKSTTAVSVSGTTRLTMPDDVQKVYQAQIRANGRYIKVMPRKLFEREYPHGWTGVGNSSPIIWVEAPPASNNALQFDQYPTPDAVYTYDYDYRARFTELAGSTEVPVIPPEFDMWLIYHAAKEALLMIGDSRASDYAVLAEEADKRAWLDNEKAFDYQNTFQDAPEAGGYGNYPGQYMPYV